MDTKRFTLDTTLTLVAAYLGLFVGLIDANAVNLALPAIRDDLGGGISGAQWTIDAYNITFAAMLLSSGSLGDRFGRRRLLRIGLTVFVIASVGCAAAPSLPLLLAARAVQGVGAALMLPQGLAITAAAFPDPVDRGRATAAWAMAAAMSVGIGPILGGVLTDSIGWRYIFWLNVPVGLLALLMTRFYLPESRDEDAAQIDIRGQILAVVGLGVLTLVLVEGRTLTTALTATLAVVAVAGIAAFVASQHRAARPMLPLDLFRSSRLNAALVATFTMTFGTYGLLLVNSFAFQQQRGETTIATALWFLNTGPAVSLAMSTVPVQRTGLASGVVNLARLVGITVGVAVLGSAMAAIGGDAGIRTALLLGGAVHLLGAAVVLIWARDRAPATTEEVCHA
jgi:EmrB/QacA subfamily drug resistance transporter